MKWNVISFADHLNGQIEKLPKGYPRRLMLTGNSFKPSFLHQHG